MKVLVPVAASHSSQYAVQQIVRRFMNDSSMEVHLLNVQQPFSHYVSRFLGARTLREWHKAESDRILEPCKRTLDNFGVPYSVHVELGEQAECITELARRLRCDEIVMATARKNSLTRLLENSVTNRVLEHTTVPVEVVAGDDVASWERYGIPAAIGTMLALWLATTP